MKGLFFYTEYLYIVVKQTLYSTYQINDRSVSKDTIEISMLNGMELYFDR